MSFLCWKIKSIFRIKSVRLWGFADFFCFYELCEFLFMGICATPVGVGGVEGVFVRRWLAMGLDHAAVTTSWDPFGVFFLLWGWADVRVERLYFVLAWWFSGCGMLCSYNVSLMVERGCMPCSYFVGRAIKRVFLRWKMWVLWIL